MYAQVRTFKKHTRTLLVAEQAVCQKCGTPCYIARTKHKGFLVEKLSMSSFVSHKANCRLRREILVFTDRMKRLENPKMLHK